MKKQWNKIREEMGELVKFIDEMNLERIQDHVKEIDRLCNVRNMKMKNPKKNLKKNKKRGWIKKKGNYG